VVLTMYDGRTNLSADVSSEVRRHFGAAVYDTVIPRSVRLSEAPSYGLPIALYRPESRGAEAYRDLASEVLIRDRRAAANAVLVSFSGEDAESPSESSVGDPESATSVHALVQS